jgi:hypothetical protein
MSSMYEAAGVLAEALFISYLQPSESATAETIRRVVYQTLARVGCDGCAALVAYEFGEHPDCSVRRMRWARQVVQETFGCSTLQSTSPEPI